MVKYNHTSSATEYCELCSVVKWPPIIEEQAQAELNYPDFIFIIACREGNRIVGSARIF